MTYEEFRVRIKNIGHDNVSMSKIMGVGLSTVNAWKRPERGGVPSWAVNLLSSIEENIMLKQENKILKDILANK